jgi:hypothetical protein
VLPIGNRKELLEHIVTKVDLMLIMITGWESDFKSMAFDLNVTRVF